MDHRLKKAQQFSYIYKKGKRVSTGLFTLFSVPSKFSNFKIGYSISKKVGKANKRNKLKRRLREIVRCENLPKNYFNYVLMARPGAAELEFDELKKEIIRLFNKWNTFFFPLNFFSVLTVSYKNLFKSIFIFL